MTLSHPYTHLDTFPTRTCDAGTVLWRIVRAESASAPWWFSASGDNRFDLNSHSGHGTCYLADTILGCLLETIWRDVAPTDDPAVFPPIAAAEIAALRAVQVEVPDDYRCADVREDTSFGITDAIGTCDNYLRPQEWAGAWHAHGFHGVAYRHAYRAELRGWAFFGPTGQGDHPAAAVHDIGDDLLSPEDLHIEAAPAITELKVLDNEADAVKTLTNHAYLPPKLGRRTTE